MSEEIERTILGTVMHDPTVLGECIARGLLPEQFTSTPRQEIAAYLFDCHRQQAPVDEVMLALRVPEHLPEISLCMQGAAITQNMGFYVEELIAATKAESLSRMFNDFARRLHSRLPFEKISGYVEEGSSLFARAQADFSSGSGMQANQISDLLLQSFQQRLDEVDSGTARNVPSGLAKVDEMLNGFAPGRLIILGARPSVGKTTLACNFALSASRHKRPTVFFSIEMSEEEIGEKIVSNIAGVSNRGLETFKLSDEEIDRTMYAVQELHRLPLRVYSRFGRSLEYIENETRRLRRNGECDFVLIDYIQQLQVQSGKRRSRYEELTEISGRLKELACELKIPVLALAQLRRDSERSTDGPQLSHLKDSGSLEQDADVVMFLHRDDEHDRPEYWAIIAKNRQGTLGRFQLEAHLGVNRFHTSAAGGQNLG